MTTRLRIAIVAPSLRILGGHSVQAQAMLAGWRDDPEASAWLVPINPVPPAPFDRLLRIKYVRTLVTQLCYWPSLVRELAKADVVHVFSASYTSFLLSPLPAVLFARALRKAVVLNYHSGEAPDHLARSSLARWVLRRLTGLNVVPSPFLHDVFERFALHAEVIPNSVDLERFPFRARTPLRPWLLSTRNLEPCYNVACTLRAFARIQARYADARLTIVGTGSQDTTLRALADELGLRGVTFAGRVAPSDMPSYLAAADVYIQTPSIDNMPVSVLEAFAAGLPVVSTHVGGVPGVLTHGVHGLLAPDDDADAVAGCVLTLLADSALAARLAAAAHERVRTCDWAAIRGRWLAAYRTAVRANRPRAAVAAEAA